MTRPRKLALALLLSHFAFTPSWSELVFNGPASGYYMKRVPAGADYFSAIAGCLLLATGFLALSILAETSRTARAIYGVLIALVVLLPLNFIRLQTRVEIGGASFNADWNNHRAIIIPSMVLGVAAITWALVRWRGRILTIVTAGALVVSPMAMITLGRALMRGLSASAADTAPPPRIATTPIVGAAPGYVLWMIFDELDYRVAFETRPARIALPELDRLRHEAVFATNAQPPGKNTKVSMPALMTGRAVEKAEVAGPSDLEITFAGEQAHQDWRKLPSIFGQARMRGAETGLVGWYHPYCRILYADLSRCSWFPVFQTSVGQRDESNFGASLRAHIAALSPFSMRRRHLDALSSVVEHAKVALAEQRTGLLFVHFPVPHLPAIYDARSDRTSVTQLSSVTGYLDNLVLADRVLGEMRRTMERLGTWDRANVVLSADHSWRNSPAYDGTRDTRIPFLVKLGGQRSGAEYTASFQTLNTGRIVLELLSVPSATTSQVLDWMTSGASAAGSR